MPPIHLKPRRLDDYREAVGTNVVEMLRRMAEPLHGLRVLHLSAGPFGSAVAETLNGLVPLQRDLGLKADWYLLRGDAPRVWMALYEGLAGSPVHWGEKERAAWQAYARRHLPAGTVDHDVVVVHDPQALALAAEVEPGGQPRWIWHCHLDTRDAQGDVWTDILDSLQAYDAVLFPSPVLARSDLPVGHTAVARPAIDPRSPRNVELPTETVAEHLGRLGVDPERPVIGQFAPIDHRYQPIGALGAYWLARQKVPGLQIILADSSVATSERARRDLEQVGDAAAGDPNVHLLTPQDGLGPTDFNVLQRSVAVVLQLAVPRGFGWGLAECQWKGKPAVVGQSGQLAEQVGDGTSGIVVENAPAAAEATVKLLRDTRLAGTLGRRGRERIGRDYLITGLLADYLKLFRKLLAEGSVATSG